MPPLVFTYNPGLDSLLDWLRFLVGDTKAEDPLLDDREYEGLIADVEELDIDADLAQVRGYRYRLAADAAEKIAARYSRESDVSIEGQSVQLSAKVAQYTALAKRLRSASTRYVLVRVERW